jgi:hypothetical protein
VSLIELLLTVALSGTIVGTLSFSIIVVLRTHDNAQGRSNNARSEQNVGFFMPSDLASAELVDTTPGGMPCGPTPACPPGVDVGGSNALVLTWHASTTDVNGAAVTTTTIVSYRVEYVDGEYQLRRVECDSVGGATPTCFSNTLLHSLEAPPPGTDFIPGVTSPTWVITVANALPPDDVTQAGEQPATTVAQQNADPGYKTKNAQRVVVTINGGGDAAGAGGGENQISLSAGGTDRSNQLSTSDISGAPTFTAARTRCGGNYGLLVDTSGSITGSEMTAIKGGINTFLSTFAGTPVKVEMIQFNTSATAMGTSGGEWVHYFDMLNDTDVTTLHSLANSLASGGYTNWEDGFFHVLKNKDGTTQAALPNTVIFFTDGVPTTDRTIDTSASALGTADSRDAGLTTGRNGTWSQIGWNRAERLVRDRGKMDVIGVFVSTLPNVNSGVESTSSPSAAFVPWTVAGAGYHNTYEVANTILYQQGYHQYEMNSNMGFQLATSGMTFEKKIGSNWNNPITYSTYLTNISNTTSYRARVTGTLGSWVSVTQAQYDIGNTTNTSTDGWRTSYGTPSIYWTSVTQAQYNATNTTGDSTDGWRTGTFTTSPFTSWTNVSQATYDANNSTTDSSDGWQTALSGTPASWSAVTLAQYNASNTTTDSTDGWRLTKAYSTPFSNFDPQTTSNLAAYGALGNLLVSNLSGVKGNFVEATPRGGPYSNAAAADMFVLPNYTNFASALSSIALGQCGGTVTMQTKLTNGTSAQDPFSYQNQTNKEVVQTSAAYRSGTFDIALPGGASQTVTILPQDFSNLVRYSPSSWTCKSAGNAYPFTVVPVAGHAPWTGIQLSVTPNQAVSCVQTVNFT